MAKIYPIGTKLKVTKVGSKDFYLDRNFSNVEPNTIITVGRSVKYPVSYYFEEEEHEAGWSATFIEDTTCFAPHKFKSWKQRYR